jgi:hypothetical protein
LKLCHITNQKQRSFKEQLTNAANRKPTAKTGPEEQIENYILAIMC